MPPWCAIRDCKSNRTPREKNVKHFSFPKNDFYLMQWIKATGRDYVNPKNARICSLHFEPSCFLTTYRKELLGDSPKRTRKIKGDAVPTIDIAEPSPVFSLLYRSDDGVLTLEDVGIPVAEEVDLQAIEVPMDVEISSTSLNKNVDEVLALQRRLEEFLPDLTMESRIVVVGACNVDLQCFTPRLPKPGETLHGTQFIKGCGGKGANQCVAAAKLGAMTAMVARLGDDSFGQDFLLAFKKYDVNTEFVQLTKGVSSGMAQITVAENGENTIVIVGGANNQLGAADVEQASKVISAAKVVVFQFETPVSTTIEALKIVKQGKGISIVNAAPALANPDPQIYRLSDIFCVNEPEAEILTGLSVLTVDDAKAAARKLLDRGCKSVIITMGEAGCVFVSPTEITGIHVPARKVKPIDTTGAGDMFIGALAYYLAYHSGLPMKEILKRSCELASLSVQRVGTQTSFPSREELPDNLFT